MIRAYYFVRNYKYDFLAAIFAIVLAGISFSLNWDQQISFILSAIIIAIFLFVIIYVRLRERDFYFIPMNNRKDRDDWIGRGRFEYSRTNNCFQITQTDAGYIYSKCLNWSDYKYEFEFKIRRICLGAILRAVNLSNCVMIQITQKGIRPHVRVNGAWSVWEAEPVGLLFPKNISFENWYKCVLICDKDSINIKVFHKKEKLLDREWQLPQGNRVFTFKREETDPRPVNIPFPINLEYGSVGFRNAGEEKALVKNVLIERI